jgi:hypothetical protein
MGKRKENASSIEAISFSLAHCKGHIRFLSSDRTFFLLQKYRLHTRRVPPATASAPANQSAIVLGGLWMAQDQYGDSSKANSSKSGSPQGPLQLAVNTGGTSTTGGDSMEDDEDAKSEGYSWKSHIHRSGKDV